MATRADALRSAGIGVRAQITTRPPRTIHSDCFRISKPVCLCVCAARRHSSTQFRNCCGALSLSLCLSLCVCSSMCPFNYRVSVSLRKVEVLLSCGRPAGDWVIKETRTVSLSVCQSKFKWLPAAAAASTIATPTRSGSHRVQFKFTVSRHGNFRSALADRS